MCATSPWPGCVAQMVRSPSRPQKLSRLLSFLYEQQLPNSACSDTRTDTWGRQTSHILSLSESLRIPVSM